MARHVAAPARRRGNDAVSRLSVSGVTKRFGGITANREISFDVAPGELVGIIGPNGSGKSTLFEVISGFYQPDAGEVRLDGARLTGLSPDRVCRLGIARTFQKLRPFAGLTVLDNVMIGALTRTRDVRHARERSMTLLEKVGLVEKATAHGRTLSTGQRKRLELARALATEPRVLLLDEVTGGVDQRSIPGLVALVRELHRGGLTLLVIEHNMRVITAVAQRIVALYLGEKIADGPPDAVVRERRVVEAYLGQAYTE
jgi:branched-chain amino acid transport system ATP-binding protein